MDERMMNHSMGEFVETNGFCFIETIHREEFEMPPHSHGEAHFSWLVLGAVRTHSRGVTSEAHSQTFCYMPPEVEHKTHYIEPSKAFYVAVRKPTIDRIEGMLSKAFVEPFDVQEGPLTDLARRLYREYVSRDSCSILVMEGLMLELFAALFRGNRVAETKEVPRWLLTVRDILHDELANPPSIEDLAARVGYHAVHLNRSFKAAFGLSPGAYLRKLRTEEACRRLAFGHAHLTIGEIILDLGFADQQHFNHVFRREMGVSPSEYRKALRS